MPRKELPVIDQYWTESTTQSGVTGGPQQQQQPSMQQQPHQPQGPQWPGIQQQQQPQQPSVQQQPLPPAGQQPAPSTPPKPPGPQQSSTPPKGPAGQPGPMAFPPQLGFTPTNINQLIPSTLGSRATHSTGPVVSGPVAGSQAVSGVAGSALLTLTCVLDYSMGNFSLPIQFPTDSLLLWAAAITYLPFTTAPSFSLGTNSGGVDIVPATAFEDAADGTLIENVLSQFPLWTPTNAFQAFLSVTGNAANTAGGGLLVLGYTRIPKPWN